MITLFIISSSCVLIQDFLELISLANS